MPKRFLIIGLCVLAGATLGALLMSDDGGVGNVLGQGVAVLGSMIFGIVLIAAFFLWESSAEFVGGFGVGRT